MLNGLGIWCEQWYVVGLAPTMKITLMLEEHMLTIQDALKQGIAVLTQAGLENPRRDVQILLGHVLHVERAILYTYPERQLNDEQYQHFLRLLERRTQNEPIAYILGSEEFYGRDFLVDRRVLIPRPETELLIEIALKHIAAMFTERKTPVIADIGTGSGIIPLTLALEELRLPYIYACDISSDALEVARLNAQRHHVEQRVRLLQGNLLEPLPEPVDMLIANLPYVGTDEMEILTADVVDYEPHLALFSGPQGLDLIQRLFHEAQHSGKLKAGAILLLEIGYQQCELLKMVVNDIWPRSVIECSKDYAGLDRILEIIVPS